MPPYTWHNDPGHAWLEVPLKDVREAGVLSQISRYSYKRGDMLFLEEDVDAFTFLNALSAQGVKPITAEQFHDEDCFIRRLERVK